MLIINPNKDKDNINDIDNLHKCAIMWCPHHLLTFGVKRVPNARWSRIYMHLMIQGKLRCSAVVTCKSYIAHILNLYIQVNISQIFKNLSAAWNIELVKRSRDNVLYKNWAKISSKDFWKFQSEIFSTFETLIYTYCLIFTVTITILNLRIMHHKHKIDSVTGEVLEIMRHCCLRPLET